MKRTFLMCAAALAGCASPPPLDPSVFRMQPSIRLCVDYMTARQSEADERNRAIELQRRGEDCSRYGDAIASERARQSRANKALIDHGTTLMKGDQSRDRVTCTTLGSVTDCKRY